MSNRAPRTDLKSLEAEAAKQLRYLECVVEMNRDAVTRGDTFLAGIMSRYLERSREHLEIQRAKVINLNRRLLEDLDKKVSRRSDRSGRAAQMQLAMPPGMWLNRITRFLLTARAHKLYVEPSIADMHLEYYDALKRNEFWHARWIALRVWFLVVPAVIWGFLADFIAKTLGR